MKYIKLYEGWLNEAEAQGIRLDSVISSILKLFKEKADERLIKLSQVNGKVFESQIRNNLNQLRNQYASSGMWSNLNTKEGLEKAINNFRELFFISWGGWSDQMRGTESPLTGFTVKINNALQLNDNDFFKGITIDNKLWRSKEAVELKDIITKGNDKLARGLAAAFILFDLSAAITNGLYYNSETLIMKNISSNEEKPLSDMLRPILNDSELKNTHTAADYLLHLGNESWHFLEIKRLPEELYSRPITPENIYSDHIKNYMHIVDFVKDLNLNNFTKLTPDKSINDVFAILFAGYFMYSDAYSSINSGIEFMEAGGPSVLQTLISKF